MLIGKLGDPSGLWPRDKDTAGKVSVVRGVS